MITTIAFAIYLRATRNAERRASVSGKGFRPSTMRMGPWKIPVMLLVAVFVLLTGILPLLALLWAAITPYPVAFSIDAMLGSTDFGAFGMVLADPEFWVSLGRTVIIAGGSATIAVVFATVLAYGIARSKKTGWVKAMDLFASSSVAIPATIAGFAMFLTFMVINPYIPIAGTLLALVIAYSYRVSIAYRSSYSATLQIRPELEEAALTSGASRFEGFRRIIAPLLMPTVMAVWIQMFILGTNEFTLPAFLATPSSRPLSMYIYAMINRAPRSSMRRIRSGDGADLHADGVRDRLRPAVGALSPSDRSGPQARRRGAPDLAAPPVPAGESATVTLAVQRQKR